MKKWFRKSLILFVQLTFGANINSQIRQSINWLLNDDSMAQYLKQIKDSFWTETNQKGETILIKSEVKSPKTIQEKLEVKK